jgi:competence protein ComEA
MTIAAKPDNETDETGRSRSILGLHRSDQLFVGVMLAILAVLSFGYWMKLSGWGQTPVEIERLPSRKYDFRLDVNHATWVQWAQLEGIGEVLAQRIIADRNQHGPFATVDDVTRVKGIGVKKLTAIREWLYVAPTAEPASPHGTMP